MKAPDIALESAFSSAGDREKLQNILNGITTKPNKLDDLTWHLDKAVLDFDMLRQLQHRYPDWWTNKPIDLVWLTKLLFLETVDGKHPNNYQKASFDVLIKTIFYLAQNNTHCITQDDLDHYIGFLMMHSIEATRLIRRQMPVYFNQVMNHLAAFREWPRILNIYGFSDLRFNDVFSEKTIELAVKRAITIESNGDLTYRDWKEGGSFNNLTLDYGRYYVEHCSSFFDQNIDFAIALKKTIEKLPNIIETAKLSTSEANMIRVNSFVNRFLIEFDSSELASDCSSKVESRGLKQVRNLVLRYVSLNLRQVRALKALHTNVEIDELAKIVGFKELDEDKREWIKHLIDIREPLLIQEFKPVTHINDNSEYNCFKSVIGSSVDLNKLNRAIDKAYDRLFQTVSGELPSSSFYKSMESFSNIKHSKPGKGLLLQFLDMVESSGIVKFVALTGWRKSEYGFSLSDIQITPNRDILDQYACPVRYAVHWIVPKTNGNTKVHRDITRSAYRCAYQLSMLVSAKADDPCLYKYIASNKAPKESGSSIHQSIPAMWSHFISHYEPFVQLDLQEELEILRNTSSCNNTEATRLAELTERAIHERWDNMKVDSLLVEARRRARDESKRVAFFMDNYKPKNWIWEYRKGNLKPALQKLLDTYLSEKTQTAIKALLTEQDVTRTLGVAISNELIEDCLYPTPHAFRHMWAEAVYRRFDGDAGWMIRSQFKHISHSMWLTYIRNKDNRRQHDQVKRQVISSLLANYLRKSGEGYAGAMDKLLRRLFLLTTSSSIEQLNAAIEQYGMLEIEDIKTNPWGYCLLRRRNQAHAKCADGGVPQRHNASPAFCLGCTNNLTQETNIPGILLGISNDLKVLNTPLVPESFRRVSYSTVSNALKQLRKLGADQETLKEIEASLNAGSEKRKLS